MDPQAHEPLALRTEWLLDAQLVFLNHGSFGACPRRLLDEQQRLRSELECDPVRFMLCRLPEMLDGARKLLADFVGTRDRNLVFVPNATAGVNTVLRSLAFAPGDELLTTSHAYSGCSSALTQAAARAGARLVIADVPFPVQSPGQIVDCIVAQLSERTRLVMLDHVTSPTALVFPVAELTREIESRGIPALIDGAHALGMQALNLDELGASFYTANCHKWLCSPKGAGLLYVRPDRQAAIRPLIESHELPRQRRSEFENRFAWPGTQDPTAYVCAGMAVEMIAKLHPLGWPGLRARNAELTRRARDLLCRVAGREPPVPDSMLGSMASVPLADDPELPPAEHWFGAPLQHRLREHYGIEVPVIAWPAAPRRLLRFSVHLYNSFDDYARLAAALTELGAGGGSASHNST